MRAAAKRRTRAIARHHAKPQPQAIMRVPAPQNRPWELNSEEVALVKSHVAKGADDTELQFCLAVARRYRLDPFRQQIWFVPRKDYDSPNSRRWIPIVGINGLLHVAARDHRQEFGTNDEPEFGPMHMVSYRPKGQGAERTLQAPEWARITLWKKGNEHPTVATVYWNEIYPNIDFSPLVRQMPRLMLGKCALAQAIRRVYPATDGLYIREEFQGPPEFTPEGRAIAYVEEGETPREAQQRVAQEKIAALKGKTETPVSEAPVTALQPAADADGRCDGCGKKGHASKDCPERQCYNCKAKGHWASECPQPREKVTTAAKPNNAKASRKTEKQEPKKPAKAGNTLKGSLRAISTGVTKKNQTFRKILFYETEETYFLFDNKTVPVMNAAGKQVEITYFDLLAKAPLGTLIECEIAMSGEYKNIKSISRIGRNEWDETGLPVIRRDAELFEREPGSDA